MLLRKVTNKYSVLSIHAIIASLAIDYIAVYED